MGARQAGSNSLGPDGKSRRRWLGGAAGVGATALGMAALGRVEGLSAEEPRGGGAGTVARNGRIKQSLVHWCYAPHWDVPQMIKVAKQLGCVSIELIDPKYFPLLKDNGLRCAIGSINMAPDPPFARGFNNPKYHERVIGATRDAIDACSEHGFDRVITFTGMSEGIPADEGARNCVEGYKKVLGHAEKKGVTLCLEMLNTRDASHPMKGHPGYQGDHTEYCIDIIKRVGSPNLKLLFDIYHVQIMDGDVIRRIREHKEYLGHIHTAGNPGRGELDDRQEIAYKPIMEALVEVGYKGHVGQEFIPTRDPYAGLSQAVSLCDV
jgi:hydroxypyruvate isomerase